MAKHWTRPRPPPRFGNPGSRGHFSRLRSVKQIRCVTCGIVIPKRDKEAHAATDQHRVGLVRAYYLHEHRMVPLLVTGEPLAEKYVAPLQQLLTRAGVTTVIADFQFTARLSTDSGLVEHGPAVQTIYVPLWVADLFASGLHIIETLAWVFELAGTENPESVAATVSAMVLHGGKPASPRNHK